MQTFRRPGRKANVQVEARAEARRISSALLLLSDNTSPSATSDDLGRCQSCDETSKRLTVQFGQSHPCINKLKRQAHLAAVHYCTHSGGGGPKWAVQEVKA